jgi:Gluconate 2-dehydrogenase subunit 3
MERRAALKLLMAGGVLAERTKAAQSGLVMLAQVPAAYKLQFFTPEQNELLDRLAEMIIPADERSPGAHEAKVSLFIDVMVANSGAAAQNAWSDALRAIDAEAGRRHGAAFLKCSPAQQDQILAWMAANETNPETQLERFFVQLKAMVINGYYTSAVGIHRDLRYQGNRPAHEFIGCAHPDHA